jgi:ABC-type transport system substrate-binding protein
MSVVRSAALVLLVGAAIGCSTTIDQPSPSPTPVPGGSLRIGVNGPEDFATFAYPDPARESGGALLRCCLSRTLLTYPGEETVDGGATLQPDLALAMPDISADGSSWTIRLRQGIHYSPPYEASEVTAADFVRAAERVLRHAPFLAEPGWPFAIVDGAFEFAAGEATTIGGLETPDQYTLVIRPVQPSGSLNWIADVVWSPIPAAAIEQHDEDLGRFWPSLGPYMHEQRPAGSESEAALIRNPNWERSTDPRRGAWVDRIELTALAEDADAYAALDAGQVDFLTQPTPGDVLDRYRADAETNRRVRSTGSESLWWLPMNLAVPPFDDVAVRRAVNAVPITPGHVFPDSLTQGLLVGYDPFASRGHTGDLARARTEMSASRYDSDGDGLCDAAVCRGIRMPAQDGPLGDAIAQDLGRIGLQLDVVAWTPEDDMAIVTNRVPLQANVFLWGFSLSGDDLIELLRGGPGMTSDGGTLNSSLVGATPEDLAAWGYEVTEVPTLDDVIDRCRTEIGHLRGRCFAELDQLVSEAVVPWVPLFSFESAYVSSPGVSDFSIDQSVGFPALDRVVLGPGR